MARHNVIALLLLAALATAGCERAGIHNAEQPALQSADSAAYLDELSRRVNVSQDEAFAGVLLLLDGGAKEQTFAQRVQELQARKVVSAHWFFSPEKPVTKGQAAYMIYQACHMTGGVTLTLAGPSERYTLRELQYKQLMSDGPCDAKVSGMEFVALLSRADIYIRTGKVPSILK